MIEYKQGDLLRDNAEALVNTVNCVGVMGRGIALQFKKAFPENYKEYAKACKTEEVQPGKMFVYTTDHLTNPKYIINFPTKRHWRGKSRLEDIESGLKDLIKVIKKLQISSIAIPPLGSGLGGLDWSTVRPLIEKSFANISDLHVSIYEPNGAPDARLMVQNREIPKMTTGRAVLIELINRYLSGLLDPFVTLLEVHKLLYFMQEAGEPLRLNYQKGPYGPYAENLRHVLNIVEGHFVCGYADGGDDPGKPIKLVPGAIDDARTHLEKYPETKSRFEKVGDLVEGFESPFGLELLSTVHWILSKEIIDTDHDLKKHVYGWNERKKQFSERQINLAEKKLIEKSWLSKVK